MLTTPTHVCCEQLRECGAERAVVVHTCMFEWGVVCCGEPVILVGSSFSGIQAVIMWVGKNQLASQSVSQSASQPASQSVSQSVSQIFHTAIAPRCYRLRL